MTRRRERREARYGDWQREVERVRKGKRESWRVRRKLEWRKGKRESHGGREAGREEASEGGMAEGK